MGSDPIARFSAGISESSWKAARRSWNGVQLVSWLVKIGCQKKTLAELRSLVNRRNLRFKEWKISNFELLEDYEAILTSLSVDQQFLDQHSLSSREKEGKNVNDLFDHNKIVIINGRSCTGKTLLMTLVAKEWPKKGRKLVRYPLGGNVYDIETFPDDLLLLLDNLGRLDKSNLRVVMNRARKANILICLRKESINRVQTDLIQIGRLDELEGYSWHDIRQVPEGELKTFL